MGKVRWFFNKSLHHLESDRFYLFQILALLPGFLIDITLVTTVFYFPAGLHVLNAWGYIFTILVGFIVAVSAAGFGTLFALAFT